MKLEQSERLFVDELFSSSLTAGKAVGVQNYEIDKLTGDAGTRRYYRVTPEKNESYVVCLDNPIKEEGKTSAFLEVHETLSNRKVRVPKLYDVNLMKGYYLEEDLGDSTMLKLLSQATQEEELDYYKKAIDELIKIHSTEASEIKGKSFETLAFDFEKLLYEIEFTNKYFIGEFLGHDLWGTEKRQMDECFTEIVNELSNQKRVLTHRDYHSRNIMVKNDELIIIDFQDARMGVPQYDLTSLLEDAYFEIERKNKYTLKKYYWENYLEKTGFQKDFSEFERLYSLMTIQRVYKAIGSFSFIHSTRKDIRYLKYIGYCFEKLRVILNTLPEYTELRKALGRIYYEY
ncbi:MAG: phosphotransferase [Bacteriovoracaceae bacterium]|nr:phosphotransferase [Bacteriovoracaceae bacterium]